MTQVSDILEGLVAGSGCEILRKTDLDAFLARNRVALLFFTGDVRQRPEGLDVAVVLRELLTKYAGRLRAGLIDRRDEPAVMSQFGVVVLPAVACIRDGKAVEVVARMRDWAVYVQACERLLGPAAGQNPASMGGNA